MSTASSRAIIAVVVTWVLYGFISNPAYLLPVPSGGMSFLLVLVGIFILVFGTLTGGEAVLRRHGKDLTTGERLVFRVGAVLAYFVVGSILSSLYFRWTGGGAGLSSAEIMLSVVAGVGAVLLGHAHLLRRVSVQRRPR